MKLAILAVLLVLEIELAVVVARMLMLNKASLLVPLIMASTPQSQGALHFHHGCWEVGQVACLAYVGHP